MSPYKIKKEKKIKKECYLLKSCLADAVQQFMLFFMVEQSLLLKRVVWWTLNTGAQCTVEGESRPKCRGHFLMFKFSYFIFP